jgi:hypothetical protein
MIQIGYRDITAVNDVDGQPGVPRTLSVTTGSPLGSTLPVSMCSFS